MSSHSYDAWCDTLTADQWQQWQDDQQADTAPEPHPHTAQVADDADKDFPPF